MSGSDLQRFRAKVHKCGANPCVDVPQRVSRAFSAFTRAGRVLVEGKLNSTLIRATLMPVSGGKHRLYINGAMRRAAGVEMGQTVRLALCAVRRPHDVASPADVAEGLLGIRGAKAAFDRLPPSQRRELIRSIDEAKTDQGRRRRIAKTADHVLGKQTSSSSNQRNRPLWTCPGCGNRFVNHNQHHSCQRHRVVDVFAGKPAHIRRLFDGVRRMVETFGPVTVLPYRDHVGFMVRVRFARVTPRAKWLDIGFWLPRRVEHPRFQRVETILTDAHVHSVRLTRPDELDEELAAWLCEAYTVGCQRHLR